MDATQRIDDSFLETDEEENEEESVNGRGKPLAKLCILKNQHVPETEFPLYLGDNVIGRDPSACTLDLPAPSVSKQHATICIIAHPRKGRDGGEDVEALVWDLGSMNGTKKGRLKLTPNVRYSLSEGDSLVVADIPCRFVSCSVHTASLQTDMSNISGVKARLPDASRENGGATSSGGKKCANGGTNPNLPPTTPVKSSWLSFEQTPNQPQDTLVPESDSDSDGERGRRGGRNHKVLGSDSDSHKSSPTCSTFLSPASKVVPESEDESSITPYSSTKNRPHKRVSFTTKERDENTGRQELNKKAVRNVEDSEEEEQEGSGQSGTRPLVKQDSIASPAREAESPVSKPVVAPDFNMDSDTDMEGEEEGVVTAEVITTEPKMSQTNKRADRPPDTVQFHMDSDTDNEDGEDVSVQAPQIVPSSHESSRPPHVISVIQPEGITTDSDTDVDEDVAVSDAATNAKAPSFPSACSDVSASSVNLKEFNLDSDTDVEEEGEGDGGAQNKNCEAEEQTPSKLDIKLIGPDSSSAASHSCDTDNKAVPSPASNKPSATAAVTESIAAKDAGADLDILSDSDTDAEDGGLLVFPLAVKTLSGTTAAPESDSDADTDVDETRGPPARDVVSPADDKADCDTDVEIDRVDTVPVSVQQVPSLQSEDPPAVLAPLLQKCSTPVLIPEGVKESDLLEFPSPSSSTFRSPAGRPGVLPPCTDSPGNEDLVTADTQCFILHADECKKSVNSSQAFNLESSVDMNDKKSSKGESFHLSFSDSSHLQCHDQALALENTQAFVSAETQANAAVSAADKICTEDDSLSDATQAYGAEDELARCSLVPEKEGRVDFALQETQLYISAAGSDSDDSEDEDEGQKIAVAETLPYEAAVSSTLAMAETQLIEDGFSDASPVCTVGQVQPKEEQEENVKADPPQMRHFAEKVSLAETQPMGGNESEENDEEEKTQPIATLAETQALAPDDEGHGADSMTKPQKRKAKQLHLEKEDTPELTNPQLSLAETQPMSPSADDDTDSMPGPRKRRAKQLHFDDETQSLGLSVPSAVETQPLAASEGEQSNADDSGPALRERIPKLLHVEEDTQPLTSSATLADEAEVQGASESQQSEEFPVARKRKAKQLQIEDEQSQTLTNSDMSQTDTQPLLTEDKQSDDGDSYHGPRKRRAKQSHLDEEETQTPTNPEVPTAETQPSRTRTGPKAQGGKKKDVDAENGEDGCVKTRVKKTSPKEDELPKRPTRGQRKTLASTTANEASEEVKEAKNKEKAEKEAKEKAEKEQQEKKREEQTLARGRRASRRTVAPPSATEPEQLASTNDDVPARRTRSRSNSSNSVSSEMSLSGNHPKQDVKTPSPDVAVKKRKTAERKSRAPPLVVQKKKQEEPKASQASASSMEQDPAELPQTPSSRASRKRPAPANSAAGQKSPRLPSASPARGRRATSQTYRVLFTGVVDDDGEKVVTRFGGIMAKGVADMNCLVTDKVRRTVKFLCAVAKGVPVVTTDWLEKSGKSGGFLSPDAFIVKDPDQEEKFNFSLQESLSAANSQPLLQGYKIHVTKSVQPEPVHMKDIISSCGATFLAKMPSTHKPQTVVISCEEDWPLCGPAVSASLPVVTAEFLLTGVLQQKMDLQTHKLSPPAANLPPAGARGRSRKKT